MNKIKEIIIITFISLGGLVVAIGIFEAILRFFMPSLVNISHSRESDIFIFENIPSHSFVYHGKEFEIPIKYNSLGFRGKEYAKEKAPNIFRIAVLGDSFVEGLQVPDNRLLTSLLEAKLNSETILSEYSEYEVMNFGVSGYGTDQELFLLTERVLDYSPNLVILFFTHNDLSDIENNLLFSVENNKLKKLSYRVRDNGFIILLKKTLRNFYFFNFLDQNLHHLTLDQKFIKFYPSVVQIDIFKKKYSNEIEKIWLLETLLIEEMYKQCKNRGIDFLIVLGSLNHQVRTDARKEFFQRYRQNIKPEEYVFDKPNQVLKSYATKHSILAIDLLPRFKEEEEKGNLVHFIYDGHWNSYGHELIAELVLNKIIEEKIISIKQGN